MAALFDLATMFPKINRMIGGMAAMVHGLSREVQELVCLIYGESEHAECVRCQYETEVGLGAPFKNWMGSLMGVFSRLRLPSLCSTPYWSRYTWWSRASGCLVTSRPTGAYVEADLCSLAFADDWLGAMCNVTEVRKVWSLWINWEVITGSKLSIKARGKTVLTGIAYRANGRPCEVKDPKLFTASGTRLPFMVMPYHAAYTSTSGSTYVRTPSTTWPAWAKLLSKLEAGLSRLRSLHNVSLKDFYVWSRRRYSTGSSARRARPCISPLSSAR